MKGEGWLLSWAWATGGGVGKEGKKGIVQAGNGKE